MQVDHEAPGAQDLPPVTDPAADPRLRRPGGDRRSRKPRAGPQASAFPPIGDYAFLSDGEVTALVAPSGTVEWMCLPRFDSPSVFGSILDRDAGGFRLGPADVMVPAARRYLPGTMVLETSWETAGGGWAIVRDVLLIGPWHNTETRSRTHSRAPTDYDAEHVLLRTVRCVNGEMQLTTGLRAGLRLRKVGRGVVVRRRDDYHQGVCRGPDGMEITLTGDLRMGFEGPRAIARSMIKEGETRFVALSWGSGRPPRSLAEGRERLVWTAHHWQHWLARGRFPDHPWRSHLQRSALTLKGLAYAPTGAIAAAATTSLPETPGWRAQLGLPLQLGPRLDVRAVGPVHAGLRLGGERLLLLPRGHGRRGRRRPGDVRHRRRAGPAGADPGSSLGLRRRPAGAGRERGLRAAPARRLGRDPRLDLPAHVVPGPPRRSHVVDPQRPRGDGHRGVAPAGSRHLGGPRRAEALHLVQGHVLGRGGPRGPTRTSPG